MFRKKPSSPNPLIGNHFRHETRHIFLRYTTVRNKAEMGYGEMGVQYKKAKKMEKSNTIRIFHKKMIHMPIHASSSLELHASRRLRRLQNSIIVRNFN
ncbi:unnamed protein product [Caenorhabditis nigoni]